MLVVCHQSQHNFANNVDHHQRSRFSITVAEGVKMSVHMYFPVRITAEPLDTENIEVNPI